MTNPFRTADEDEEARDRRLLTEAGLPPRVADIINRYVEVRGCFGKVTLRIASVQIPPAAPQVYHRDADSALPIVSPLCLRLADPIVCYAGREIFGIEEKLESTTLNFDAAGRCWYLELWAVRHRLDASQGFAVQIRLL